MTEKTLEQRVRDESDLSKEEMQILISILEQVSVQGTETMKKVTAISDKLKKAVEEKDKQVK